MPYSCSQMYKLVSDIDNYKTFLRYCVSSRVLSENNNQVCGELLFSMAGVTIKLVSLNTLFPESRIEMRQQEGTLESVNGIWSFEKITDIVDTDSNQKNDKTKVVLVLSYEIQPHLKLLGTTKIVDIIAEGFVQSFINEAERQFSPR